MTLLHLEMHPEAKKKLVDEIDATIKTEEDINNESFKKMPYMNAVLNETGRVYGPGTGLFVREVVAAHDLKGVPVSSGTLVIPEFAPNNHNEAYYKNPHEFVPERWLGENKTLPHPYLFTPFSSGPRNCIGQHLAVMEAKVILVKLLKRYDISIQNPDKVKLKLGFLVTPEPFDTELIPRRSADHST